MNKLSVVYSLLLMMTTTASLPLHAEEERTLSKVMMDDKYYLNGKCALYLKDISPSVSRTIMEDTKLLVQQDVILYMSGSDTILGLMLEDRQMQTLANSSYLQEARDRLKRKRDFEPTFTVDGYSHESVAPASKRLDDLTGPSSKKLDIKGRENYVKYLGCGLAEILNDTSSLTATFKAYDNYVMSHVESATVGYFDIATGHNRISRKVGTGNPYAEPKTSQDSRFFIVDASFKNNDTESRLPSEGSLFINYKGKEYEYDSPEPIMLEGYNIWFRKVNPLLTVKTKIVYRVPNEIEGEVFWRPGRNGNNTRLWVGNIAAKHRVD